MNVFLVNQHGKQFGSIIDEGGRIGDLIPWQDLSFLWLRFIDPYGDTIFNRVQMEPFLIEWIRLAETASNKDEKELFNAVEALASRCQSDIGLFLKFQGD